MAPTITVGRGAVLLSLLLCCCCGVRGGTVDYTDTANAVLSKLLSEQFQQSTEFHYPAHWQEQKGIFESSVLFNLHGNPMNTFIRHSLVTPDINAFVTLWIVNALLDMHDLGVISVPETVFENAVNAIVTYKDKNHLGSMCMTFWPQKLRNGTYTCYPENIEGMCGNMEAVSIVLLDVLKELGIATELQVLLEFTLSMVESFENAFPIPPDFDDTFCNLGMGSLLNHYQSEYTAAFKAWQVDNSNPESLWGPVLKYSYQPMSSDINLNTIDTRTYFFMRDFLEHNIPAGTTLILPTTWIQSIDENRVLAPEGVVIPFNVNNVDASVSANVLYGLTSHILDSLDDLSWFTADLQQLYTNTTNYLAWTLESNMFAERPDLGLLYYPDPYAYIWFVSRTARLLNNADANTQSNFPQPLKYAQETLTAALEGPATVFLLNSATRSGTTIYWEQWLGAADVSEFGMPTPHHDDRMFTTGAAVNNLFMIWAGPDSAFSWLPDTPQDVKLFAMQGAAFINATILDESTPLYNAFFSGSVKGNADLPFAYPANFMQYFNGTALPAKPSIADIGTESIIGMTGIVDSDVYEKMISQIHFGYYITPMEWPGFNEYQMFPFWSAEPLTLALDLSALVKATKIA